MEDYAILIIWACLLVGAIIYAFLANWLEVCHYRKKLGDKTITHDDIKQAFENDRCNILPAYMDVKHTVEREAQNAYKNEP